MMMTISTTLTLLVRGRLLKLKRANQAATLTGHSRQRMPHSSRMAHTMALDILETGAAHGQSRAIP